MKSRHQLEADADETEWNHSNLPEPFAKENAANVLGKSGLGAGAVPTSFLAW